MLQITIPAKPGEELWDAANEVFIKTPATKEYKLNLEHSLVSLSKWESKWNKAFLSNKEMSLEESIDYVKCMTLTQNVPSEIYNNLTNENIQEVSEYIKAPMTATWFPEEKGKRSSNETVTAELIYYWMIALNIPMECQKWHLNKLLTLVRVCNNKNAPPKTMGKKATMSQNAALNAARRKRLNSRG